MNRIDRLSALLIHLQSKPLVKAQDIADRFCISLRTVYRDIKALEEGGVPIIGEAGSGYRLMEGYKLPPVMFTEDEASAMLTASKFMQSMTDGPSSRHYTSALDKIKAVLRLSEKQHIAEIDEHIAVIRHPAFVDERPTELHLPKILKAIASSFATEISYTSMERAQTLQRRVEPIGIYYQGNHWYLVAFCRLRNDYRVFRTDRINRMTIINDKITAKHPPLQSFINQTAEKRQLQKVVIEMDGDIVKYFGDQKYYNGFLKEETVGNKVRMTFLTGCLTGFSRWSMFFGDAVSIIEPAELKVLVFNLAQKILKKVGQPETLLT
jgi:predicted DNA-binding transcriptional regulator YafY